MGVTIKDVAKLAKASISTVSKALNDSYEISEETKNRVREAARTLKYKPNKSAQTLVRGLGREITFVANIEKNMAYETPHFFEIISGAEKALADNNYLMQVKSIDTKNACFLIKELYERKQTDGFLIHASALNGELSVMLVKEKIPYIVIGKPHRNNKLSWIDNNNQLAGNLAGEYLLNTGHKKIVFIGGSETDYISQDRLEGVLAELNSAKLEIVDIINTEDGRRPMQGEIAIEKKLEENTYFDSVICASNSLAYGVLQKLLLLGYKVPQEISIVTFDSYPFSVITSPTLTSIDINLFDMGYQAVKYLLMRIKRQNLQVQSYSTLPTVIIRESTRDRTKNVVK